MQLSSLPVDQKIDSVSLSLSEQQELSTLETIVSQYQQSFDKVGNALTALRDRRLYRDTHPNFESYCQDRWEMSSRRANQLIQAAEVIQNLVRNNCSQLPTNEAQVRHLTSLAPQEQCDVWNKVLESSAKPTASLVKQLVEQFSNQKADSPNISAKVLLSRTSKKIYEAVSILARFEIGEIREAVFSFEGEQLGLPRLATKVADSFHLLELDNTSVVLNRSDF